MGKILDRTGQIFNNMQIVTELGYKMVECKCLRCSHINTYAKPEVVRCKVICKNCGKRIHTDKTGNVYNSIKVIEELGDNKVKGQCLKCGLVDIYKKNKLTYNNATCKCSEAGKFIDRTGQTFGNLKIVVEHRESRVTCECIKCKKTDTYNKQNVVRKSAKCKHCGITNIKDRTGEVYNNLQIIKELGKNKVECTCIKCGHTNIFLKNSLVKGGISCRECTKQLHSIVGNSYNNLKVIKYLGDNKIECSCNICMHIEIYRKHDVLRGLTSCRKCSLYKNYKGRVINNITVIDMAYVGRDKQTYFKCRCNTCQEVEILTREEIGKYTCNKP